MNKTRWILAGIGVSLVLASLTIMPSDALSAGQKEAGNYGGCGSASLGSGCHSQAPSPDASLSVTGFPPNYQPGKTYTVTVALDGPEPTGTENQGGFFLGVSSGTLSVPSTMEGKVWTFEDNTIATHRAAGNDQRTWTVYWQAPQSGTVSVQAYGNAVDGNAVNDDGDHWAQQALTVSGPAGSEAAPGPGLAVVVLALAGLAVARRK